jgi:hypothetical protein
MTPTRERARRGAEAFYAKEMGFFAKAGLDVDVQTIASGVPAAIASKDLPPVIDVSAKDARYDPFPAKELLAPA